MKRVIMVLLVLVLVLSVFVAAGGVALANKPDEVGNHNHGGDEDPTQPVSTNDITMLRNKFDPDNVRANRSDDIIWTNAENKKEHTVHIMNEDGTVEVLADQSVAAGDSFVLAGNTLASGTTYFVHCTLHNKMEMTLTTK